MAATPEEADRGSTAADERADLARALTGHLDADDPASARTINLSVAEAIACLRMLEAYADDPHRPVEFAPLLDRLTALLWEKVGY